MKEVGELGMDDLYEINKYIVSCIRHLRANEGFKIASQFRVGQTVSFKGRKRDGQLKGQIVKCNPTKAKVKVLRSYGQVQQWNVPYSFLSIIK